MSKLKTWLVTSSKGTEYIIHEANLVDAVKEAQKAVWVDEQFVSVELYENDKATTPRAVINR